MDEELIINAKECCRLAEERAAQYFAALKGLAAQKAYVPTLMKDLQTWKHQHIHYHSFFLKKKKPDTREYFSYIQWLDYTGKLDHYLERSISYIFMRDLGKALDDPETQTKVRRSVDRLKNQLTNAARTGKNEEFSMAWLYRQAQKEGIESTIIWLADKLKTVSSHIPKGMDADQAKRKLIKIIAGVVMHTVDVMDTSITPAERRQKFDQAIRIGYSYGLTYPFIDDILDADVLSDKEKRQYSELIRTTLATGTVPELGGWPERNRNLIQFVYSELREAFVYLKANQRPETRKQFFEQSYVFFQSQETDRAKNLFNAQYTNEELYIPIILKSSYSRLIARSAISAPADEDFDNQTFFYGIYNQLSDDFTDLFDDLKDGAVTPYTYYLHYHEKRPDLINPFELYWAVIFHLVHHVYHSDARTCEVILDRAINGLKRFKKRMGAKKYYEVMELFASGIPPLNHVIQKMVQKAEDVDFFDKLLRDHIMTILKNDRKEQEEFLETIESVRNQINHFLKIPKTGDDSWMKEPIMDAANYCLESGGKRLRPIMTWVMGVKGFGLSHSAIVPLLRSLEYMHTASLIFDDLPSQDNASIRRGRPTLHQVYNVATAELTGLFLTQKAVEEQASLDQFDAKTVLGLIQYSAKVIQAMCMGQAMDLDSKGKPLTREQLNRICFYKTGIAFEASLIMPAILAHANEEEMGALKKYAHHTGIAFQIKDDLLDVEGDLELMGKPIGKDAENNTSTFVSVLGREAAEKEMWNHYCFAMEALEEVPRNTAFFRQLLNYMVNRDH